MTVKSSISLTDEQDAFARQLVEMGRFPSVSAALQQGLELLRVRFENDELELQALRTLLLERQSGKIVSNDEMIDAISGAATHKRAKHGI
ncbi:MAG TPA: type II toxin-antitoxin system ParD family antitoxin [Hyphomonas sp.]|nr:type II toxin-antitoxin system ParD family antitoxin [Hyphomonas sp.]HRI99665.1 type II toxin-antitoxin system ParD family antitoxin [Hyphomonas sp.]HRK66109.1 type II toxin-antitoxin system ParD family antitoxin [Hyphomonas sp.]